VSDKRNLLDTFQDTTVFTQLSIFLSYDKALYSGLEVLSRHIPRDTEKDHEKTQDSLRPGRVVRWINA
jgi:hypothetical protein